MRPLLLPLFASLLLLTGCEALTTIPPNKPGIVAASKTIKSADGTTTTTTATATNDGNPKGGATAGIDEHGNPAAGTGGSEPLVESSSAEASNRNFWAIAIGALVILSGAALLAASKYLIVDKGVGLIVMACGGGIIILPFIPPAAWVLVIGGVCAVAIGALVVYGVQKGWFLRVNSAEKEADLLAKDDPAAAAVRFNRTGNRAEAAALSEKIVERIVAKRINGHGGNGGATP